MVVGLQTSGKYAALDTTMGRKWEWKYGCGGVPKIPRNKFEVDAEEVKKEIGKKRNWSTSDSDCTVNFWSMSPTTVLLGTILTRIIKPP